MALRKVTGSQAESLPLGFSVTEDLLASGDSSLQAILDSQKRVESPLGRHKKHSAVAASCKPTSTTSYVAKSK